MPKIKITKGANFRLSGTEIPKDQAMLLQNVDMTHGEILEQIKGSVGFHGTSLGSNMPKAIIPYYNNVTNEAHVLVAEGSNLKKKSVGPAEFSTLIGNLTPNEEMTSVNIQNEEFIGHPKDGILRYDGISKVYPMPDTPNLKDLIHAQEINRCFGIDADIPNLYRWTDDLTTMGGIPQTWDGNNSDTIDPTDGDALEKLGFLDGRLIFFMTNSTWIEFVNTSPANWRKQRAPTVVGWIAPKTIKLVGEEYWGLGFSPKTGIGLYAFNGRTSRLLSYDAEPEMRRINPNKVREACAELVDNIYKLSYSRDFSQVNNFTIHFDTINSNPETNSPLFYGPHTYGFNCSALLNTRQYKGQQLIGTLRNGEARIYEVSENYKTQYSSGIQDDGDLINPVILTGIIDEVEDIDDTFIKRFGNIYLDFPLQGSWAALVEILKDYENETYDSYDQYLEGESNPLDVINLGSDAFDFTSHESSIRVSDIVSQAIQFKISLSQVRQKLALSAINFDAKPVRKEKGVQRVSI